MATKTQKISAESLQNYTNVGILGMEIYHLATLIAIAFNAFIVPFVNENTWKLYCKSHAYVETLERLVLVKNVHFWITNSLVGRPHGFCPNGVGPA
jgi:hypothetical protein